jgi:hypothetical protein
MNITVLFAPVNIANSTENFVLKALHFHQMNVRHTFLGRISIRQY